VGAEIRVFAILTPFAAQVAFLLFMREEAE
jgi:hypothetical protein